MATSIFIGSLIIAEALGYKLSTPLWIFFIIFFVYDILWLVK